jgi:hypothetical protein
VNHIRALLSLLPILAIVGCGSNAQEEPKRLDPSGTMATPQKKYEPTTEDTSKAVDVAPYPGATLVAQEKDMNPGISPDEARYRITLASPDAVDKVKAYYEKVLKSEGRVSKEKSTIMGRSERGNAYIVDLTRDGDKTKIVETVIVYKK